jgi:hypothetical protein
MNVYRRWKNKSPMGNIVRGLIGDSAIHLYRISDLGASDLTSVSFSLMYVPYVPLCHEHPVH